MILAVAGLGCGDDGNVQPDGGPRGDGGPSDGRAADASQLDGGADAAALDAATDATMADAAPMDGPVSSDGAVPDARTDAGAPCPPLVPRSCTSDDDCLGEDVCFRSACVDLCGADKTTLDDALDESVAILAHFCRRGAAAGVRSSSIGGCSRKAVFELRAETDDPAREVTYTVERFLVDATSSAPPATVVGTATSTFGAGASSFVGSYLATDAAAGSVLFGYTTTEGFAGEVLAMDIATGEVTGFQAPGNFDAAWIEPGTFLVNGLGALGAEGGQGLYWVDDTGAEPDAVQVFAGPGDASGSVAILEDDGLVLVGGFDFEAGDQIAAVSLEALRDAAETGAGPLDPTSDGVQLLTFPSSFEWLGDRLATFDFEASALETWSLDVSATGEVTVGGPLELARAPFSRAVAAGGDEALLIHRDGTFLARLDGR
jgi:hypothetical protein